MRHFSRVVILATLFAFLSPTAGLPQDTVPPLSNRTETTATLVARVPYIGDLSVVGSDGTFYRVGHQIEPTALSPSPSFVPPGSRLEAFDLNPNNKGAVDVLFFLGLASHLAIGKDNRLFLIVNPPPASPPQTQDGSLVLSTQKNRLYIIPTPFPPRALGASLESIATTANSEVPNEGFGTEVSAALNSIVQLEFEGAVTSFKVKSVGDKEYLYITVSQWTSLPAPSDNTSQDSQPGVFRNAPMKVTSKFLIFNSDGQKIKEIESE